MLGATAAAETAKGPFSGQEEAGKRSFEMKDELWNIMASQATVIDQGGE